MRLGVAGNKVTQAPSHLAHQCTVEQFAAYQRGQDAGIGR